MPLRVMYGAPGLVACVVPLCTCETANYCGGSLLFGIECVFEDAEVGDLDFDGVAGLDGANARGSSRGDQVARFESHHAGNPADEKGRRKYHQRSASGLAQVSVNESFDGQISW